MSSYPIVAGLIPKEAVKEGKRDPKKETKEERSREKENCRTGLLQSTDNRSFQGIVGQEKNDEGHRTSLGPLLSSDCGFHSQMTVY